jgi:hypothetical protein
MKDFTYSKEESVYKYYTVEDILKLDTVPDRVKEEIKNKLHKKVFFGWNDGTKIGKLKGIEVNRQLSLIFYLIEDLYNKHTYYIPCEYSLTLL